MIVRNFFILMLGFGLMPAQAELIFSENFDDQPDWATTGRKTVGVLPLNWDAARTDEEWHPADGDLGTQPSMMINGNNPEQVFGGTGKAFISYSESYNALDDNGWTSDGIITKDIAPTNEVYVKFDVKFQSGWADNNNVGQVKLFRLSHLDQGGLRYKFFSDGDNGPIYIYDWAQSNYGLRHLHSFRCDDQKTNYYCTNPEILGAPRAVFSGSISTNYTSDISGLGVQFPDLVNGGILNLSQANYHNNIFGTKWHTVEFYFKLNSAPGVQDGVFEHWLDGQKIVSIKKFPWIGTNGDINAKWNTFSIGGNDFHHFDLEGNPVDRERWYSIDNVQVHNSLPSGLAKPPTNFNAVPLN